jgi:hypothetical protein
MWDYLSKLHPFMPYSVVILGIIAIVIIALRGKLMVKWDKTAIGLGSGSDSNPPPPPATGIIPPPPGTVYFEKKRSCADCLHIVMSEHEKYGFNKQLKADKILTYRMNYSEEKLMELENDLFSLFEKKLDKQTSVDITKTLIESKMFYGLLKEALYYVKKEIRKSYKEDGFCDLSDYDFDNYVNDKTKAVLSTLTRYLRNIYPAYGTSVSVDDIILDIESKNAIIHEYVRDIFTFAKQIIVEYEKEMEELKIKFQEWAFNFVK